MLVEDSVRELLTLTLEEFGYTVLPANNGVEAISNAERYDGTIDLMITDVVMPKIEWARTRRTTCTGSTRYVGSLHIGLCRKICDRSRSWRREQTVSPKAVWSEDRGKKNS